VHSVLIVKDGPDEPIRSVLLEKFEYMAGMERQARDAFYAMLKKE
jgi:hypothetical protein